MKNEIRNEIRKVFMFLQQKEQGRDEYSNNGYVLLSGKKYFVGEMSYNEWYLEPYRKYRKETDEFSGDTLWENSDCMEILQIFADNDLIEVRAR